MGRGSTLLLNVPPDKRGLIHELDVAALKGWRQMLDSAFSDNLAAKADVTASEYRGESTQYQPSNTTDGDKETYWTTNDETTTASIEVDLGGPKTVKRLLKSFSK